MIPNQIRVFDGLRITTEHVEHLQAGIATAVQDLRALAGLACVHRGFEVTATSDAAVEVGPGLAFDAVGNRIVSDEPRVIAIAWQPGESELWVCIGYEQVLGGEVEQHPTLVFDSGAISLEDALPAPDSGLLPIARLARESLDTNGFRVETSQATQPDPAPVVLGVAYLEPSEADPATAEVMLPLDFIPASLSADAHLTFAAAAGGDGAPGWHGVTTARGEATCSPSGDVTQQSLSDTTLFTDGTEGAERVVAVRDDALAAVRADRVDLAITIVGTEAGRLALRCGPSGRDAASPSWHATVAWKALRP